MLKIIVGPRNYLYLIEIVTHKFQTWNSPGKIGLVVHIYWKIHQGYNGILKVT